MNADRNPPSLVLLETGILVKFLWPPELQQLPDAMPEEAEPSDANQQVPRCIEDMLGWAHLGRRIDCRDRTRRYTLFYTSGNENGEGRPRVQLGLRVQGFVQRLNISPFGNWMG